MGFQHDDACNSVESILSCWPYATDELLDTLLGSASFFSSYDMLSGFHQILVGENSIPLTAFCTTSGLYEFLVMPMGTSGSPGHFQQVMQQVTADVAQSVTI